MIKTVHSYWAYLVLLILIFAVINAFMGLSSKRNFLDKDKRISLFTVIVSHIQLILGLAAYYFSSYYTAMKEIGMGAAMKDATLRKNMVEHPLLILVAITLITIGFSSHKKKTNSKSKFKTIAIFYTVALVLILAVIPWEIWFS